MPKNNNDKNNKNENNNHDPKFNNDNDDNEISIEKVFELIKEGKEDQSIEDYWTAADKFVQAQDMLMKLANNLQQNDNNSMNNVDNNESKTTSNQEQVVVEEQTQIIKLYKQQAREYLFQSRQCLIEAMSRERSDDEDLDIDFDNSDYHNSDLQQQQHFCQLYCKSSLSNEQAQIRIRTFAMLFSKYDNNNNEININNNNAAANDIIIPPPIASEDNNNNNDDDDIVVEEQQQSLEERLQNLNASIPSDLKTSKERMDDINKGLNRLGLSLYPQRKPFERFQDELHLLPKDEDEQVNDIMAQVQDEVAIEKQFGTTTSNKKTDDDDDDYSSDDESDDDDNHEQEEKDALLLDDEQLAMKIIRSKVVKAQTRLAELVAYLDEAKIAKQKEEEEDDDLLDDDNDDSIEKPDYTTYLTSGKKKLKSAKRNLKKAMMEWTENLS